VKREEDFKFTNHVGCNGTNDPRMNLLKRNTWIC